ncbi:MAG: hypothetical protein AAFR91_11625 [Pseudomonadota bacterium]
MKLIITKSLQTDQVEVVHADGSRDVSEFPKKGVVPHDAVHWIVEREMGMKAGFWGTVSAGMNIDAVSALSKAGGHASSKRASVPEDSIVELIQAERLVECFEADMWSTPSDAAVFREVLAAACSQSHVPAPSVNDQSILSIRQTLSRLREEWAHTGVGESVDFGEWLTSS